ncbi:anaphase-promoting complex subunit cdc27 [Arachnomyces sp. PD_36]|nr:anaphase-promoting complex subunit cdc27 [Arachnomyces sp. PD_36]
MSPSTPHISSQLRQLIYYHLDNNLIRNALFLAGRLHAYEPRSSEASYLLALCHLQSGQTKAAWEYSRYSGSRGTHVGCSYVHAQACLDLGKYIEGIKALERSKSIWSSKNHWNKHSETRRQHLPDAAAVLCLQGKLWHAHKDLNKAVECYAECLRLNPFVWDAFLGLCETGVNIRIPNIYRMAPEMLAMLSSSPQGESVLPPEKPTSMNGPLQVQPNVNPNVDPFTTNGRSDSAAGYGSSALWEKLNGSTVSVASAGANGISDGMETPVAQSNSEDFRFGNGAGASSEQWEPPSAPARKSRPVQPVGAEFGVDPPPKMRTAATKPRSRTKQDSEEPTTMQSSRDAMAAVAAGERKRTVSGQVANAAAAQPREPGAPQRRSVRLFNQIRPTSKLSSTTGVVGARDGRELKKVRATGTKGRNGTTSTVGRVVSGNRKHTEPSGTDTDSKESRSNHTSNGSNGAPPAPSKSSSSDKSKDVEALNWILDLFAKLAGGYFALNQFKCQEAIQTFNTLSQGQRETPWVLSQIGKAYYEQAMYPEAEKYFVRVKNIAPFRLEDTEVYSTVLWHQKNGVELAYLAHELMEVDRLSPQAWCAIGNSFSLSREHDQALKCFKRATQLDPKFAYAFTLQGHEYVANEEYEKALDAYRNGINADTRHYNAWYGLGKVYEKMGKLEVAEQHFRTAANINPTNAVLVCCIGLVLEKLNNPNAALLQYGRACSLQPQSVLARFRKARAFMKLHELKLALVELKILKDIAPDEANVHYLLGKLYKMLHDKANAIKHFTTALNLDPKAAQYIKDAMESLDAHDDEDDDEDMA